MSPLIVFGNPHPNAIPEEWDWCSGCGNNTQDYVTMRLDQTMVNVCNECVHALGVAMAELIRRRAAYAIEE